MRSKSRRALAINDPGADQPEATGQGRMKIARNSLYILSGSFVPLLLSFATVPLFVEQIGVERYGALAIAWLLLGYFGAADFGIGRAITQRIAVVCDAGKSAQADAVWSALISIAAFSGLAALVIFVFANWYFASAFQVDETLRSEILSAIWVLALCNPVVAINGVLAGALMGLERFRMVALSNVIANSGLLIFPLAVAYFVSVDLTLLIASALAARLLGLLILGTGVWQAILRGQRIGFSRDEFKRLANFGAWVMVSSLIGPLMIYADRFLIGVVLDAVAVAAYTIPFQVAYRTLLLPNAVSQALFPRLAAEELDIARLRGSEFAAFTGQIFAPLLIGLLCLAQPLMELWLGSLLDPRSVLIGQLLLLGCWANAIALFPLSFLQARGLPRFTAMLHVCELPFYLVLLWVLGAQFGLYGFAAAFGLRCLADCIVLLIKAQMPMGPLLKRLFVPALLLICALLAGVLLESTASQIAAAMVLTSAAVLVGALQMPTALRPNISHLPIIGRILAPIWK